MAENRNFDKLQKVFIEFMDKAGYLLQYEQESLDGAGLDQIKIPFNVERYNPDKLRIKLFANDYQMEFIDDYKYLVYLTQRGRKEQDKEYEKNIKNSLVLNGLSDDYFGYDKDSIFPEIMYEDVTEQDLFGYPAIPASDLRADNKGVWSDTGFRKIEIKLKNLDIEKIRTADTKLKVSLYWYEMDKISLDNIFEEEIRYDSQNQKFITYVDTNKLGDAIVNDKSESFHPKFSGRFELHIVTNIDKVVYGFPIELVVRNTRLDDNGKNPFIKGNVVSIDFGTSSTCAAIKAPGRNKLLTLSGINKRKDEGDNAYENPTNLMIYNWREVFRQWEKSNLNCPFLSTKSESVDEQHADYDSGYTVEDEYKLVDEKDGRRKMQAILIQLKMIPYQLADGKEVKFVPYDDESRSPVIVVDDVNKEDGLHFDAIAFYGYLLGRAINNPANGEIYKRYQITYPSKFNDVIREKIRDSLEYGIKRALPYGLRNVKDGKGNSLVTVTLDYSEPEACMGAVVRKQFKLGDEKAKLFAVYDLGGGTMDFAFGILRKATEDELDEADETLQFFGIDGDEKIGGEKLIHQLAYNIYLDSEKEVKKKEIKFVKPDGLLNPRGFEGLLSDGDEIANTNLNIVKEKLARYLFKHPEEINNDLNKVFSKENIDSEDEIVSLNEYKLSLRNVNNEPVDVTLTVKDVDEFINNKIKETVDTFKKSMTEIFNRNNEIMKANGIKDFNLDDVEIFLGGHASQQHYVLKHMREVFPGNKIERVGEGQNDDTISEEYVINEKTAVAFGQLRLGELELKVLRAGAEKSRPPFLFNIGYYNNDDEFARVISKNENDTVWKKANRVNKVTKMINLYYTSSSVMKPLEYDVSEFMEGSNMTLYIRIVDERSIEFRIGSRNEAPSDSEEIDSNMVIRLSE